MKIIDERETQNKQKKKKKNEQGDGNYSERVRDKWFWAFKLGFLQLICKFLSQI